jgi:hypothetical protein
VFYLAGKTHARGCCPFFNLTKWDNLIDYPILFNIS